MRLPFERGRRRRIYLMRHAEAAYIGEDGKRVTDPRAVPLTAKGRAEAAAMAAVLKDVQFDRAMCSGLPRTLETARTVLAERKIELDIMPELEEIRGGDLAARASLAPSDYAYMMFRAAEAGARFAAGEQFIDFIERVVPAFETILTDDDWTSLLLVCHGGTNRAIITRVLGLGLESFGVFEQDSCCLNILDFDQNDDGVILRRIARGINLTPLDAAKVNSRYLTLEGMAKMFSDAQGAPTP